MKSLRVAIFQENNWWVAVFLDFELATQAGSEAELHDNLQEALALHGEQPSACPAYPAGGDFDLELISPGELIEAAQQTPSMSFRHVRLSLERQGFRGISQKGNHAKFICRPGGDLCTAATTAILPHYTELTGSVVASVARQARLSL